MSVVGGGRWDLSRGIQKLGMGSSLFFSYAPWFVLIDFRAHKCLIVGETYSGYCVIDAL